MSHSSHLAARTTAIAAALPNGLGDPTLHGARIPTFAEAVARHAAELLVVLLNDPALLAGLPPATKDHLRHHLHAPAGVPALAANRPTPPNALEVPHGN